jgi:signal transduction histidine kinase
MVGTIQYARSLRGPQQTVNRLVLVLLPLALGGVGLSILGGLYMAGRAVRPVRDSIERQKAFVADASHELKTPLTLIRADAEVVLLRGEVTAQDRALIEHALAETDRMGAILSSLLAQARLDAGQVRVSRKPFDLTAILAETAERFGARAASEEIRLEVRVPEKIPARGDPEKTGEILAALLDNALRHTPSGGSVNLTGGVRDGLAEALVRDTGPGIPPDHLPRIFERFYRSSDGRTRESGGTGLGLTIARDLARAQGGDLYAENIKEGGAAFRLQLPRG